MIYCDTLDQFECRPFFGRQRYSTVNSRAQPTDDRAANYLRVLTEQNKRDRFTDYESYNFSGWDGDDADPITQDTIETARRFEQLLKKPQDAHVAPGADGTIGFEWRSGGKDDRRIFFVEVTPDKLVGASLFRQGRLTRKWALGPLSEVYRFLHLIDPGE